MSLINDALRKAQKQRTGETVPLAALPSVGGESAARIHKRGKPAGFYTLLLRLGLGAGGLAVLVIGGYFALRQAPENRAQKTEDSASPAPAIVARPEPSPVVRPPSSEPAAPVAFSLPVAPPVQKTEDREQRTAATTTPQRTEPAAANPQVSGLRSQVSERAPPVEPVAVVPAPPAAKMEGKAINFIENLRIAGIRASATDAKVLMNDRVYRINDIVEHELNLKLVGITSSSLTFEDEHGARYTRSF